MTLESEDLERFARLLHWDTLTTGGRVTQILEITDRSVTWVDGAGARRRTDLKTGETEMVAAVAEPPSEGPLVKARTVRQPDADGLPAVMECPSPDGRHLLTEVGHDLAVRDVDAASTRVLTRSGTVASQWRVNAQVTTLAPTPQVWSPNGRHVFSVQARVAHVPEYPYIDWWTEPVRAESVRIATEQSGVPRFDAAFVDVSTGDVTRTDLVDDERTLVPLRWSADGAAFLTVLISGSGTVELARIDGTSGRVTVIATDTFPVLMPYLGPLLGAVLLPLRDPGTVGWLSDADGDLRLYRLDLESGERTALTPPGIQVVRLVGVDADQGLLMLARTDPDSPRDVHVARTTPAGEFVVLSRESGVHDAILEPAGHAFVDNHSALTRPPRADLRSLDGELLARLDTADTRAADAIDRMEPVEFQVKAADGETDLFGVLYLPPRFDPERTYPVIDSIYSGPQAMTCANSWSGAVPPSGTLWTGFSAIAQAFAQLGFVGMVLDTRGTPGRGRAFQAAATDEFGTLGVRDRVTALRELAARHRWLDITRTGAIGISFGGYFAARCGIVAPEVYRAVVAASGPYDFSLAPPYWFPSLLGTSIADDPEKYARAGVIAHAEGFQPELLLIQGLQDRNVLPANTIRFSDRLVRAGKHHDLLLLAEQRHQLTGHSGEFALVESARFFVRHLIEQPSRT